MIQSLPIKHRPKFYKDLVGQDLFVRFLRSLSQKGIGRNLIFWGQYGSGKTSSARIYAKSLNCFNLSPEGDPCYTCEACKDTSNIVELDAASSSGKEDVKDLLEIAKIPPLIGKYRIIIADEAQQFSKAAWDALLKSIEEPKPYQVFIFSTTELYKVREAIKSRCQCLEVKLLSAEDSKKYLKNICTVEGFKYEEIALDIISFMSKGHIRDLLKNLEQVSFLGDVTVENTKIIFNLSYLANLLSLTSSLSNKEYKPFRKNILLFEETPRSILEILRQFYLFLYYTFVNKSDVEINPAFSLIPSADLTSLWKLYEVLLEGNPVENFQKILIKLNSLNGNSFASLEIGLMELHNYIHIQKFQDNGKTEIIPRSTANSTVPIRKGKGRQFVTLKTTPLIIPEEGSTKEPVSVDAKPIPLKEDKKVYPHTLLQYGFLRKELKNENDLIIFEEIK